MSNPIVSAYVSFISDVDVLCSRMRATHESDIVCRKGCSSCCMSIGVSPLEWYSIRQYVRHAVKKGRPFSIDSEAPCVFLADGYCGIYPVRPLICRTHGFPLLYRVDEYDENGKSVSDRPPEYDLILCDLNFADMSDDLKKVYFNPENTINMEDLNERLIFLNRKFIETREGKPFEGHPRLPLSTSVAGLELK